MEYSCNLCLHIINNKEKFGEKHLCLSIILSCVLTIVASSIKLCQLCTFSKTKISKAIGRTERAASTTFVDYSKSHNFGVGDFSRQGL